MPSFSEDITEFTKLTGLRVDQVVRKVALDGYTSVLLKSPVDTGRFRASWRVGVNRVDTSVEPPKDGPSPLSFNAALTGAEQAVAQVQISQAKGEDVITISNNLPYAKRLEDGWSPQTNGAQAGILGKTFLELRAGLADLIASIKNGQP